MAFHPDITRKDDVSLAIDMANAAVRIASKQLTGNSGTVEIPNADGTSTIMGVGAGETGVAPWVGDTTPPGKPTGITAESHNGAVWVSWDGTLDGGIPADFDHVQFTAVDGSKTVDMGQLTAAGKVTAAELTAGDTVTITAIAYDDAHDSTGASTPNASVASDPVTVVVQSAVDAAVVKKAQDDAQSALDKAGQATDTATASKRESEGAKADAANAVTTANSANDTSAHASSTAQAALSAAQSAQKDTVTQWVPQYAVNQSTSDAPTTGWSVDKPSWTAGHYIWLRTVVGYGSGDYTYSNPVLITGNPGADGTPGLQGPKGDPGARGPAGVDGKDGTSVKIKGSVASASQLPGSAMVGDGYLTDDTGHLYVWGDNGWTDVGAIRGPNGVSAYVHTAWSDSSDGKTNFSLTDGGTRTYMGVYADNVAADSTNPGSYTWTRIVGPQGQKGDTGKTGPNGPNGSNGVSVTAITPYWALGTSAPAQPAVSAPPSPWQSTEPGYSRNQHLYKTSKVTYDNGQFAYMPVVMDSSYEYSAAAESSARDAVQTATNANTTAQTAKSTADSASSTASTAKSTADSASSVATQANATAVSANQSATSAQTAANLALQNAEEKLKNPTFVNGFDGWYSQWRMSDSPIVDHWGVSRLLPVCDQVGGGEANKYMEGSTTVPVNHGQVWQLQTWAKVLTEQSGKQLVLQLKWYDASGDQHWIWVKSLDASAKTDWTFLSATVAIPSTAVSATLWLHVSVQANDAVQVLVDSCSFKDITEAQAAQKAADDAQATADKAQVAADNANALANTAQAAAQGAQTTADGKNKIFSSATQPSSTGLVPGDLWFQLDSSNHVTGIQTWNGSAFVDYLVVANEILVAGSVGTTQIANGAITTDLLTSNAVTAIKIAAQTITGDKLNVGSVAAAIITSGLFKTADSGARVTIDSTGIKAYESDGNVTFQVDSATGKATMVGGMATALSGKRISISQSGATGKVALLNDGSELSSLTFVDDTDNSGYMYTGLYTGQNSQFMQFATLVDNVNHQPNPKVYDASITARGKMLLDASNAINVNGTWFAHDLASLPTAPQVVGGQGTKAFVGGIEYTFDGGGAWVSQTHTWDDAMCVAVPTASSSTVNGTTSVRMDTMTGDSDAYTRGSNYIQVAHAGTYLVSGALQVSGVSGGYHHANVAIGVDGYSFSNRYMGKEVGGGPGLDGAWITAVYPAVPIALTAGQRVYLIVACDVAGAVIEPNGCLLSITRIGD